MTPRDESTVPPVDATLRRIVVAYRVLAVAWMTALVASTLATDEGAHQGIVITAWVIGVATAVVLVIAARDRSRFVSWPLLIGDGIAVALIGISPGPANAEDLYFGGFLLAWLLLLVYARPSFWLGTIAVVAMGATQILVPIISDVRGMRATDVAGDLAALVVTAFVFGWGMERIRRSERERMAAEAALADERVLRARADDRAEIGSHLHDSVLQTLALIQQRAGEPPEVEHLARRQERELRRWIDQMSSPYERSLRAALRDTAADVEDLHRISVEVVVVGDRDLDAGAEAVVQAAGEALVNAARHSGRSEVSLYAELEPEMVRVFVRDRGDGFDPEGVGDECRGLRDSIGARMERHGGTALVRSTPGEGTEVELVLEGATA